MAKHQPKPKPVAKGKPAAAAVKKPPVKLPAAQTDWQWWIFGLLCILITFFVFRESLSLQFVNWDDPDNILLNENLKVFSYSWDWASVKKIFTSGVIGNYNPLPIFTFALEKRFFSPFPEQAPFIFHLDNLLLHLVCTFLAFVLFTQLGFKKATAFIGALLFGLHPMRVESVAWITERKDVLYGAFFLGALAAYIQYARAISNKMVWYALILFLSIFAYFAKIQTVTLPLTMVAIDYYLKREWRSPKLLILEKLPWWLLSLIFGLLNVHFLKEQRSFNVEGSTKVVFSFLDRLAVGAYAYATYLIKWIAPFKMSPLYPYPPKLPVDAYISLAVVPVVLIAFLYWAIKKYKNDLLFGWAFFTLNVMFLLQVVGAGQGYLADRFTYIAYFGLFFILLKGLDAVTEKKPSLTTPMRVFAGLYLAALSFLTLHQVKVWENSETLWEHVKAYFPNSPLAWKQAGNYYRDEKKDFAKALENYNEAVRLEPTDAYVYNSVAKIYMDKAFSLDQSKPDFSTQQHYLVQMAIKNYDESISRDSALGMPDKKQAGETIVNRGVAYAVFGNFDRAIADLTRGLEINPNNTNGYLNRGLIYFNKGQWALSLADHDKYIQLDPYNADMYHERALCKLQLGDAQASIADFNQAIFLKNNQPLYYYWRAQALRKLGRNNEALQDARRAKELGLQVPEEMLK